jgi:hypothetical protein
MTTTFALDLSRISREILEACDWWPFKTCAGRKDKKAGRKQWW